MQRIYYKEILSMLSILSIKYALCIETLWNYYVSFVDLKYLPLGIIKCIFRKDS
jgi:hypothetical protein